MTRENMHKLKYIKKDEKRSSKDELISLEMLDFLTNLENININERMVTETMVSAHNIIHKKIEEKVNIELLKKKKILLKKFKKEMKKEILEELLKCSTLTERTFLKTIFQRIDLYNIMNNNENTSFYSMI